MRLTQIFFLKNQDIFSIIERLLKYKLNKKFLKQTSLSIKVPNKEKKMANYKNIKYVRNFNYKLSIYDKNEERNI